MIYIYERNEADAVILEKAGSLLSRERMEKLEKYKFQREKELCCMAFLVLRYGLSEEYGINDIPEIYSGKYGKPYMKNRNIFFNISHCDNSVMCSISRRETGADIQDYCKNILDIRSRILSEGENRFINSHDFMKNQETARFWTLKESYGKYHGFGLGYDFAAEDFSSVESKNETQHYKGLTVFSKCYEKYAVSVFSEEPLQIRILSYQEMHTAAEKFIL